MDNDKKQVIPRSQYRRKRREYFHNEEREERIKREREALKQQVAKEKQQSKVNEERVKDNLRKARIEKLTQEEIQQQHEIANQRQKNKHEETNQTDALKPSSMSKKSSNSKELGDHTQTHLTSEDRPRSEVEDEQVNHNHKETRVPYSITNQPKDIEGEDKTVKTAKENDDNVQQEQSNINETTDKKEVSTKDSDYENNNQIETSNNITDKRKNNDKRHLDSEQNKEKPYSSINHHSDDKENDDDKGNDKYSKKDSLKTSNKNDNFEYIKNAIIAFFKEHWPKLLIIIGIILLLLILNAIFTTVNKNDHTNDSAFNGNDKNYTTTMKNANNSVKSVVTVQNNVSNNTTIPKSKSGSDNEIGSGVVYKKVGDSIYILTNAHVVGDKDKQKVTYNNNKSVEGKVVGKDKWSDIAVVKAKLSDESMKPITLGDSNNLVLGQSILVVGNPLGVDFKGSVSKGIISGLDRHVPVDIDKDNSYDVLMKAFQVDAPVNPGNSGGAVVDKDGRLIGIISLKIDMENVEGMAFAIPINDVRKIAQQLEDNGKVQYPNTGIKIKNVADISSEEREEANLPSSVNNGVLVNDIKENSLGEKSGLKKDDVIVELDGKTVEDNLRYRQIIFSHRDDLKTLTAKIYRNGTEKTIQIKLK
ncbi:trypsin-like peptidase domain-containing protein [Staphylococcus capitis]|uniref:trypsin-like peptidase domain-containing protein n=1 Tax=Staphylococcus TaxID=1279 RepID=UPI0003BEA35F|nr:MULTISPECIES: trypsin-like peptidase domain-containing protein [Staphylococcus]ATN03200.1 serine protease [Staphylococcus capitis]MBF0712550.1 trypsin-like peptidase domain-containing protein [Staphylococcus capitis]MBF2239248.1 trypsin-like peptidase domain-containing protein [Staphylococcus capitis]MBF2242451.1 trypsin-like peptidase domain-containing protein [Staphylococcus capitis]MBF2244865.1 trypsin-like peptidase domain-containing protein [Staphylococcus capitis]